MDKTIEVLVEFVLEMNLNNGKPQWKAKCTNPSLRLLFGAWCREVVLVPRFGGGLLAPDQNQRFWFVRVSPEAKLTSYPGGVVAIADLISPSIEGQRLATKEEILRLKQERDVEKFTPRRPLEVDPEKVLRTPERKKSKGLTRAQIRQRRVRVPKDAGQNSGKGGKKQRQKAAR